MRKLLLVILLIAGCNLIGQDQFVPKSITMNPYTYLSTHGNAIDPADIYFKVYHSTDNLTYTEIDTFTAVPVDLITSHEYLYDDSLHYFYVTAYRISNFTESVPSNIDSAVFPVQLPDPPSGVTLE